MTSQSVLVGRTFKQLEELNEIIDRYSSREQAILETLTYLMTTLKSLQGWAVFAIFPSDNVSDGKTYSACVEQRFQYCSRLLHHFSNAVQRRESNYQKSESARSSPRESEVSPRDCLTSQSSSPRSTDAHKPKSKTTDGTLRQQISVMAKRYIDEGAIIQNAVVDYLERCHQELLKVLQWGVSSVDELKHVIDEAMAEMLVFTVKSRMWRLMSNIGDFEEAAHKVRQTMSQEENAMPPSGEQNANDGPIHLLDTVAPELGADDYNSTANSLKDSGILADCTSPPLSMAMENCRSVNAVNSSLYSVSSSKQADDTLDMTVDWRNLYLKNWVMDSSRDQGARRGSLIRNERCLEDVDEDALLTGRSDGSTPEPPASPRPQGLVRHPRILKDKLDKLHRSLTMLPGSLAAVLEDGDTKSVQGSWNVSSTS